MNRFARWRLNRKVPDGFRIDIMVKDANEWSTTYKYEVIPVTEDALSSIVFNGNDRRHDDDYEYRLPLRAVVWSNYVGISTHDAMKFDLKPGDIIISRTTDRGEKSAVLYAIDAIRELQKYAAIQNGLKAGTSVQTFGDRREVEV